MRVRFWNHAYDFRPNCPPLSSITIINNVYLFVYHLWIIICSKINALTSYTTTNETAILQIIKLPILVLIQSWQTFSCYGRTLKFCKEKERHVNKKISNLLRAQERPATLILTVISGFRITRACHVYKIGRAHVWTPVTL